MSYKPGDESECKMCGEIIRFVSPHWEHLGELQPRHPAWPNSVEIKGEKIDQIKQKSLELCWKIETLPASELQTEISIMASELKEEIERLKDG